MVSLIIGSPFICGLFNLNQLRLIFRFLLYIIGVLKNTNIIRISIISILIISVLDYFAILLDYIWVLTKY